MSVKKNVLWNMLLTLSGYVFPLLTFPYITRVLGAESIGIVNYTLSIVDYAVLFSTLGLSIVGIRYISQCGADEQRRSKVFSTLVSIHLLLTSVALVVYLACAFLIPSLAEYKGLCLIGTAKILFNVMLIEWLFQGMQDFRYVTVRSIVIKLLYVASVFLFVRNREDYEVYFYLTVAQVVVNALVNWNYAKRYIRFHFSLAEGREYVMPILSMGLNSILLSSYTSFNVICLGSMCGSAAVGYYTTATRLYGICISLISAYNGVFIPHLNAIYAEGDMVRFRETVNKSIHLVSTVSFPIIILAVMLAPQIIEVVAGSGFDRVVLPFQILLVQVLLVGIAQILENQVLLAFKKFREIVIVTAVTTFIAAMIILVYVPEGAEVAAACAVAIPHVVELLLLVAFATKLVKLDFSVKKSCQIIVKCVPIAILCWLMPKVLPNSFVELLVCGLLSAVFFLAIEGKNLRKRIKI